MIEGGRSGPSRYATAGLESTAVGVGLLMCTHCGQPGSSRPDFGVHDVDLARERCENDSLDVVDRRDDGRAHPHRAELSQCPQRTLEGESPRAPWWAPFPPGLLTAAEAAEEAGTVKAAMRQLATTHQSRPWRFVTQVRPMSQWPLW